MNRQSGSDDNNNNNKSTGSRPEVGQWPAEMAASGTKRSRTQTHVHEISPAADFGVIFEYFWTFLNIFESFLDILKLFMDNF